jgi:hypothetical protein
MVEKPREYSRSPLAASSTSTLFWPRSVLSIACDRSPGQGKGSITTRSSAYWSDRALPLWV